MCHCFVDYLCECYFDLLQTIMVCPLRLAVVAVSSLFALVALYLAFGRDDDSKIETQEYDENSGSDSDDEEHEEGNDSDENEHVEAKEVNQKGKVSE